MKDHYVKFRGRTARNPDEYFEWEGYFEEGVSLISFLDFTYSIDPSFVGNFYEFNSKRLYPYHLITVDKAILFREEMLNYTIRKSINIEIIPFVSGG